MKIHMSLFVQDPAADAITALLQVDLVGHRAFITAPISITTTELYQLANFDYADQAVRKTIDLVQAKVDQALAAISERL